MQIAFLPAVCVTFTPKDGKGEVQHIYRPYSTVPLEELEKRAEEEEERGSLQELGERFYFGLGVDRNYIAAYNYLLRAAEQDVQDAQYLVAECYREGHCVKQDYQKYFEWLNRAAENGSWMAMLNLCSAYREGPKAYGGFGPKIDHTQCFEWTRRAEQALGGYWVYYTQPNFADFGEIRERLVQAYARVSYQLSQHYALGMGVKCDTKMALNWLFNGRNFVSRATGMLRVPMFDDAIAKLQARAAREQSGK